MMKRTAGFTLIELMVAVTIIGIIAAIALPSYIGYTRVSRRSEAIAEVGRLQLALERWRADRSSYAGAGGTYPTANALSYYAIAIPQDQAGPNGYTITATAQGDQVNDTGCTTLTLTAANGNFTKTPAGCWND